jgi:hypothetical protein
MNDFATRLEQAKEIGDIFILVKETVRESLNRGRAGIMLGLSPLGFSPNGFIGAYHQLGSNLIVMNSTLLNKIGEEKPSMLRYYSFHLLLHEYLHSLGIVDEGRARAMTYLVSKENFGEEHIVTKIAENFEKFLPNAKHPGELNPPETANITLIPGFDKEGTDYIG